MPQVNKLHLEKLPKTKFAQNDKMVAVYILIQRVLTPDC